jgi:hypothetical protein
MGNIVGGGVKEGIHMQRKFMNNMPALRKLKEAIDNKVQRGGTLTGLDGRILRVRSGHKALNMLLQSAGAVCMKVALIQLFHALGKNKWQHGREYAFVANIHDEFQAEVIPDKAEDFGKLSVKAIQAAGKELKLNVQLDGEYKVGYDFYTTLAHIYDTQDLTMPSSNTQRIGAIAETRFITECLERDFEPHTPTTPMPWDYIVHCPAGDLRVQIKSTSVRDKSAYTVNSSCGSSTKGHMSDDIDVVGIYIAPLKEWWMIPRYLVKSKTIKLYPDQPSKSKYKKYQNNWGIYYE